MRFCPVKKNGYETIDPFVLFAFLVICLAVVCPDTVGSCGMSVANTVE